MVGDRVKCNWEKWVVCAVCITSGRNASRFSVMYIDGAGVRRYADCTTLQGAPKEAWAKMCVGAAAAVAVRRSLISKCPVK